MYAEVSIPLLSGSKSLLVPNNAIIRSTEHQYVIVVDNGKANLVNIKEGLVGKGLTEVFGDLHLDEKILVNAGDEIKQGDTIK